MSLDKFIQSLIKKKVKEVSYTGYYREPLVGFAQATSTLFNTLKEVVSQEHYLPKDILPEAKTVIAFFIPFSLRVVLENLEAKFVARVWAESYIFTNRLIKDICKELCQALGKEGMKAKWVEPTHNFDTRRLLSQWSHKHIAYAAGLGLFGHHHMLITKSGAAGRLGSVIIDREVDAYANPPLSYSICTQYARGVTIALRPARFLP
jgi:epoxyqueuosine reductase